MVVHRQPRDKLPLPPDAKTPALSSFAALPTAEEIIKRREEGYTPSSGSYRTAPGSPRGEGTYDHPLRTYPASPYHHTADNHPEDQAECGVWPLNTLSYSERRAQQGEREGAIPKQVRETNPFIRYDKDGNKTFISLVPRSELPGLEKFSNSMMNIYLFGCHLMQQQIEMHYANKSKSENTSSKISSENLYCNMSGQNQSGEFIKHATLREKKSGHEILLLGEFKNVQLNKDNTFRSRSSSLVIQRPSKTASDSIYVSLDTLEKEKIELKTVVEQRFSRMDKDFEKLQDSEIRRQESENIISRGLENALSREKSESYLKLAFIAEQPEDPHSMEFERQLSDNVNSENLEDDSLSKLFEEDLHMSNPSSEIKDKSDRFTLESSISRGSSTEYLAPNGLMEFSQKSVTFRNRLESIIHFDRRECLGVDEPLVAPEGRGEGGQPGGAVALPDGPPYNDLTPAISLEDLPLPKPKPLSERTPFIRSFIPGVKNVVLKKK